ncbi:MAG: M28 family peptidase [Gemmatimonadota bacterium]|nr:M28 family peptidase [Gemmatimonadota bacterium]
MTAHSTLRRACALLLLLPAAAAAQAGELPLKHKPQPTSAAISAGDLMTRLYIFADDSMQGRETGTVGHLKATAYIAAQVKALGLKPAGDHGTYFQNLPVFQRSLDARSTLTVNGTRLSAFRDWVATPGRGGDPRSIDGVQVIFGGEQGDTVGQLTADQARGKLVILTARPGGRGRGRGFAFFGRGRGSANPLAEAAGIATVETGEAWEGAVRAARPRPGNVIFKNPSAPPAPQTAAMLTIDEHAAQVLLGVPLSQATKGMLGKTVKGNPRFDEKPAPARNVVAILPGSDPKLRGEYVAIGAHNDHIGIRQGPPVDHDSLHLYNAARYAITGMLARGERPSAEQEQELENIHINLDSVRKLRPVRLDSISNGADDDGSGSVTVLELAEAFAKGKVKPRRSILFVWHVGEEKGLWGSEWFTDQPTVPRDSIVAQLNMDMVGRGDKQDLPVGGPTYLQLVGSHRLSTELGDLVESVNKTEPMPFSFDYRYDAPGQADNIYCRSDHYNYARYGIPITFFTTGLHGDYHQVTDEPEYIDYDHMARVGQFVFDVAMKVADLDHRVKVDGPVPADPHQRCVNNGAPLSN